MSFLPDMDVQFVDVGLSSEVAYSLVGTIYKNVDRLCLIKIRVNFLWVQVRT